MFGQTLDVTEAQIQSLSGQRMNAMSRVSNTRDISNAIKTSLNVAYPISAVPLET